VWSVSKQGDIIVALTEGRIKQIIREELLEFALDEGIFDGAAGQTSSKTQTSAEKAAVKAQASRTALESQKNAKSKIPAWMSTVRADLEKMETDELRKTVDSFKTTDVSKDPKSDERALGAVLKLSKGKISPQDLSRMVSANKSIGAIAVGLPGGLALQDAVAAGLKAKDKSPDDPTLAWKELGDIVTKQGLA
jgi:hypothetical protein